MESPPRKILVFASGECSLLHQQVAILSQFISGMNERDIVIEKFCLDKGNENKFKAWNVNPDSSFAMVLIGRDGGEKFKWYKPVNSKAIFDLVDVMPMRIQEIKSNSK